MCNQSFFEYSNDKSQNGIELKWKNHLFRYWHSVNRKLYFKY